MKKILLFASALAGLFLAGSCQKENLEPAAQGGVTYEITLPGGPQTKGENGYDSYDLHYEVYKTANADALATAPLLFEKTVEMTGNKTTLTLDLLNDQDYTILFWANKAGANENNQYFDLNDLRNVVVKTATANNDNRDAFCGMDQLVQHDGAQSKTVELKRPFAQINIATLVPTVAQIGYDVKPTHSYVKVSSIPTAFNVFTGLPVGNTTAVEFSTTDNQAPIPGGSIKVNNTDYNWVAMNYVLVPESVVDVEYQITTVNGTVKNTIPSVPVKKNYRTNIIGNLLTSSATYNIVLLPGFEEGEYTVENGGNTSVKVTNAAEFTEAFADENMDVIVLGDDIDLNELMTRAAADPTFTVAAAKTLTIDLGGHKLSATSAQSGKSYEMFLVKGNLTVKNGTIEYEHKGDNMGWGAMTCIFDVTAGGALNLEGVTAKNLGGSDMGFVAHLNNWGEVTLNAENCTLESNYVAVRVFNSGYDMNNVTIKNSTLKGGSYAFWVHNYTEADFGTAEKAEAQKALLNLDIYDQSNTLDGGVRYGMTNKIVADGNGITKTVSEDGSVVTLGTMVENGIVARYAAGAEENNIVTKAVVGEGISILEDRTFRKYYALETVELPSTLTALGVAGEQYTSGNIFQGCSKLTNITIPESVTTLGMGTFYGCTSLTSINVPAGVTRIEKDTFRETGLTSIEFHEGVTYFGDYAFRDCENLTEVIIKAPYFEVGSSTFLNAAGAVPSLTIYVANREMKEYLEPKISSNKQFKVVVPGLVYDADEFKAALADTSKDIITLAAGVTYEGVFEINRGVEIVSESADNKAIIKGRVNVKGDAVTNLSFTNVAFAVNNDSKVVWTSGGSIMKQKPSIVMAEANNATIKFEACDFQLSTSAFAYTNSTNTYSIFNNCIFNGTYNYVMYVRANTEVTNCVYNTEATNLIGAACISALKKGKVVFVNNTLPNGANIGMSALILFASTNNENGEWVGPVEFTVKNNTGFQYTYERLNNFIVDPDHHTFTDGSERFSF